MPLAEVQSAISAILQCWQHGWWSNECPLLVLGEVGRQSHWEAEKQWNGITKFVPKRTHATHELRDSNSIESI